MRKEAGSFLGENFLQEHGFSFTLGLAVGFFPEAVTFIHRHKEPGGHTVGLHRFEDLLGFRVRNARVIEALDHEERLGDLRGILQRRDFLEEGGNDRIALVAAVLTRR